MFQPLLLSRVIRPRLFLAMKAIVDIRPELFDDVRESIGNYLLTPIHSRIPQSAILSGVISVGQASGEAVPDDFGVVKSRAAGIILCNKDARERVGRTVQEPSTGESVITRILVRQRREIGRAHV